MELAVNNIKRLLMGILLGVNLYTGCEGCLSSKPTQQSKSKEFEQLIKEAEADTLQITLEDLIDIPVAFNINHFYMEKMDVTDSTYWILYGHTNYPGRTILLNDGADLNTRRLIYLHEMYHIINNIKRPEVELTEDEVTARAYVALKKFYPSLFKSKEEIKKERQNEFINKQLDKYMPEKK